MQANIHLGLSLTSGKSYSKEQMPNNGVHPNHWKCGRWILKSDHLIREIVMIQPALIQSELDLAEKSSRIFMAQIKPSVRKSCVVEETWQSYSLGTNTLTSSWIVELLSDLRNLRRLRMDSKYELFAVKTMAGFSIQSFHNYASSFEEWTKRTKN